MLRPEDIDHLAMLARISLSEEEKSEFPKQLEAILTYVGELSSVATKEDIAPRVGELRNVMRSDEAPRSGGEFTSAILADAPETEDGYVKVKQIL